MRYLLLLSLILCIFLSYVPKAYCDDEVTVETVEDEEGTEEDETTESTESESSSSSSEEEEDLNLQAVSEITFNHIFPEAPLGRLESGKMGNVLIGMTNKGKLDYTIHTVEASFRHPEDYNAVIQNFTTYKYGVVIKPGEEATISYRWPIYELYEPTDFTFCVVATYEDSEGNYFRSAGFNGTITVVDPIRTFDAPMLFVYLIVGGAIGGIGYTAYRNFNAKQNKGKGSNSSVSSTTTKEEKKERKAEKQDLSDFLPEHHKKRN